MRRSLSPYAFGFARGDLRRLVCALRRARLARVFRRIQAVLLVAQGRKIPQVARTVGLARRTVYRLVHRYLARHRTADLSDAPRPGRPASAPGLTRAKILQEMRRS